MKRCSGDMVCMEWTSREASFRPSNARSLERSPRNCASCSGTGMTWWSTTASGRRTTVPIGDRSRPTAGASTVLVYLEASHEELWARVSERNARHAADPNSIYFAESDLIRYRNRFVPPGSDEPHLLYDGDPDSVLKALDEAARQDGG